MAHRERVPTDIVADDLVATYRAGVARLEGLVASALQRGLDPARLGTDEQVRGDATAAYRERQLAQARATLAELQRTGSTEAAKAVNRAYNATLLAVDRALPESARIAGAFGGIHHRAVTELASNLTTSLDRAAGRAGANLETVFARAAALTGADKGDVGLGGLRFIGRRVDDPWRELTLQEVGQGLVTGETRRQISQALHRRLLTEGVTDALTGFVDSAGRRWDLARYTEMAVRTTTREATTRAAVNRMTEHGLDLVTISSHPHAPDECTPYDGETFSMNGDTPGYPVLDDEPPFHPNCIHVITPAAANLDDYEAELAKAAGEQVAPEAAASAPRVSAPAARLRGIIDAERGKVVDQAMSDVLEARIARQTGNWNTAMRLARAHREGRLGELSVEDAAKVEDALATITPAEHAAIAAAPLDEAAVNRIGGEVMATANRRAGQARRRIRRELDAVEADRDPLIARWRDVASGTDEDREIYAQVETLMHRYSALTRELDNAGGEALRTTLAEVRPGFGEGELTTELSRTGEALVGQARADITETMASAAARLPREWVEASNEAGRLRVEVSSGRAHYNRLGGGEGRILVGSRATSVALHELGHRMEDVVEEVRRLESSFYVRRTRMADGALEPTRPLAELTGNTGYDAAEVAREDRFTNPYIGKAYSNTPTWNPGAFYEVLTMGLEGVFYGRHGIERDLDLQRFIAGLLAAV